MFSMLFLVLKLFRPILVNAMARFFGSLVLLALSSPLPLSRSSEKGSSKRLWSTRELIFVVAIPGGSRDSVPLILGIPLL